jgi:hypothetical protein
MPVWLQLQTMHHVTSAPKSTEERHFEPKHAKTTVGHDLRKHPDLLS